MDFSKLKSLSGKKSLEALTAEVNKLNGGENGKSNDDTYWKPTVDKSGNGYAVIRFLPAPPDEDVPFVRIFDHGFQGPTGIWYIENSLTTIGKQDPVSEYNSKLWNSGIEANKEIARKQKRRVHYVCNIYVVSDPGNPANEKKVFRFKYGKKLFDKQNEAMNPQFADEEAFNPFDLWTGANFKLKIRHVEGYRNYDKSEFEKPAPLSTDDSELERIWKSEYSLQELLAPNNFKSYDELKERLTRALNEDNVPTKKSAPSRIHDEEDEVPWKEESVKSAPAPKFGAEDEDEDESLEFFRNLAN